MSGKGTKGKLPMPSDVPIPEDNVGTSKSEEPISPMTELFYSRAQQASEDSTEVNKLQAVSSKIPKFTEKVIKLSEDGNNYQRWIMSIDFIVEDLLFCRLKNIKTLNEGEDRIVRRILFNCVDEHLQRIVFDAASGLQALQTLESMFSKVNRTSHAFTWREILETKTNTSDMSTLQTHINKMRRSFKHLSSTGFIFDEDSLASLFLQLSVSTESTGPYSTLNQVLEEKKNTSFVEVATAITNQLSNWKMRPANDYVTLNAVQTGQQSRYLKPPGFQWKTLPIQPPPNSQFSTPCHHCLQFGHWKPNCPSKLAGQPAVTPPKEWIKPKAIPPAPSKHPIRSGVKIQAVKKENTGPEPVFDAHSSLLWEDTIFDSGAEKSDSMEKKD